MQKIFDCVIVGGGHGGCEAALAAVKMGCKTALITIDPFKIALMPCNPSIGGVGKGHLVKEIDVLGGQMAKVADKTLIQIKRLNGSKGPAVQALRAQIDKSSYSLLMRERIIKAGLELIGGAVSNIRPKQGGLLEVSLGAKESILSKSVVLTTGTFLNGRLIVGDIELAGGRMGEPPASGLADGLRALGIRLGRLQTATPPRLDGRSIDLSKMEIQPGDQGNVRFSDLEAPKEAPNTPCYLTYTNERTHEKILSLIHLSPIQTGTIESHGPRNCPSIDRKVINFPNKVRHPVFIEPEGLKTNEVYPQGLTTALPAKAQLEVVRATPGLEKAKIVRAGYAVEYDYVLPDQLGLSLESELIEGLFFAGQIIGTTGYEEAAALGLVAGINAALKVKGEPPLILARSQAYIGVLIDDLVTKEHTEPYRIYTSRAEHRLILREDDADLRLSRIGCDLGLIGQEEMELVERKREAIEFELEALKRKRVHPNEANNRALMEMDSSPIDKAASLAEILRRPEISYDRLEGAFPELFKGNAAALSARAKRSIEMEIKYEGYVKRQQEQVKRQKRMEERIIPEGIDFHQLYGLSFRARESLSRVRPRSLGQAARVSGVTPADSLALLIHLEKEERGGKHEG